MDIIGALKKINTNGLIYEFSKLSIEMFHKNECLMTLRYPVIRNGRRQICNVALAGWDILSIEMTKFNDYLNEQMKDPAFKEEWDALEPEFTIMQAMIDARKASGLTQKQLSERTGIAQADISKLESGNANPSLKTLQRLAAGMGMKVKVEFYPVANSKRTEII